MGRCGAHPARVARLFDPLLKGGADWADIYFQSILSRDWLLEDGAVRTGSFVIDRGAGMRTVTGERQTLAYANARSTGRPSCAARKPPVR